MFRLVGIVLAIALASDEARAQGTAAQPAPTTLTLREALHYAVDHYPSVRAAVEQLNAATANVSVARSAYLPRFDALWQTNHGTANNLAGQLLPQSTIPSLTGPVATAASGRSVWGTAVGGLFSWEPVDFGLRVAAVREAEAALARATADEALTRLAVQQAVGAAFLDVVTAEQAIGAADADVQRRDVLARAAHTLADNQLRAGAEASRADAELAAARTRAIQVWQLLAVAKATLARVLGLGGESIEVDAASIVSATPPGSTAAAAASEHPLLRVEQAAVEAARAREDVLNKTDRPRLCLQSSVFARGTGINADGSFEGGADGLGLDRANWAAGIQIVFPNLFDSSALRARRAAAGTATRAEGARYDETVLTLTQQQRTADATAEAARAVAENTPVQLAAGRQSEAQARARYDAGLAAITEVADAQTLLAGAEYLDAAARIDLWRALLGQAVARGSLDSLLALFGPAGGQSRCG